MVVPIEMLLAVVQAGSEIVTPSDGQSGSALRDFWNLVEQAGPLRWPIFAVLGIGLVLVIHKLYELVKDRSQSAALLNTDYRSLSLKDIRACFRCCLWDEGLQRMVSYREFARASAVA